MSLPTDSASSEYSPLACRWKANQDAVDVWRWASRCNTRTICEIPRYGRANDDVYVARRAEVVSSTHHIPWSQLHSRGTRDNETNVGLKAQPRPSVKCTLSHACPRHRSPTKANHQLHRRHNPEKIHGGRDRDRESNTEAGLKPSGRSKSKTTRTSKSRLQHFALVLRVS